MNNKTGSWLIALGFCLITALPYSHAQSDEAYLKQARELHSRIVTLDSHLDAPSNLMKAGWDIGQRLSLIHI